MLDILMINGGSRVGIPSHAYTPTPFFPGTLHPCGVSY